jgi:hypothetical protein
VTQLMRCHGATVAGRPGWGQPTKVGGRTGDVAQVRSPASRAAMIACTRLLACSLRIAVLR